MLRGYPSFIFGGQHIPESCYRHTLNTVHFVPVYKFDRFRDAQAAVTEGCGHCHEKSQVVDLLDALVDMNPSDMNDPFKGHL